MNALNRLPLLWKVLSAPAIAMICMALYTGYTAYVFKQNNVRLVNVRDMYFPVLDLTTENVGTLEKIIDNLNNAAAAGEEEQLLAADKFALKVRANNARLLAIDLDRAQAVRGLGEKFEAYYKIARLVAAGMVAGGETLDKSLPRDMAVALEAYRKDLTAFRGEANLRFNETVAAATGAADRALVAGAVMGVLGLVVPLAFALLVTRALMRQLRQAVAVARTVAAGDLTSHIEVESKDETGQLMGALNEMNDSLVRIVGRVRSGTDTIAAVSVQIARGNMDLSRRTEQQASSLEQTAASMEELMTTVRRNAENASEANQLAIAASEVAARGGAVVSQVVGTMGAINESAKKIVDIIGVIDSIAFQTNILALNAAVEAARAGEQGRGFAVVATEVRNLAQRSAAAAQEIKALIGDSVNRVDAGSKLVNQAGSIMDAVVSSIHGVTDIMGEITTASQEQTSGIGQINQAIVLMDGVTQQNATLMEEAAAAAVSLEEQATSLAQVVGMFIISAAATVVPPTLAQAGRQMKPKALAA